jgi:hypothetical protein
VRADTRHGRVHTRGHVQATVRPPLMLKTTTLAHNSLPCCLQAGVNPLAGCLPTLATIPIFIGLYSSLTNAANEGLFDTQVGPEGALMGALMGGGRRLGWACWWGQGVRSGVTGDVPQFSWGPRREEATKPGCNETPQLAQEEG